MTLSGGSSSRPATPAVFCAAAAALHVEVVYATNSRLPMATKLSSFRSDLSSKTPLATILPRKCQKGNGRSQSYLYPRHRKICNCLLIVTLPEEGGG